MKKDTQAVDPKIIWAIVGTGILAFTGILTETSMNVTFPDLMKQFGISLSVVQWLTTAYLLMVSLVMTTSAFLKAKFNPRMIFMIAIIAFLWGYCGNLVTLICLVTGWTHYSGDWDWRDYAIGVQYHFGKCADVTNW